ncbi:MAG: hypothetical protein RBS76_04530 [Acholeplasmatales bacterium]|nr:hypothetical protein [Acholeplasmataceae bacterium]MCK9289062.1 hypothetical protein [Acholeplasmataceae bacterium]MCK9427363.1 hypothetical protein [Acholeplasmataceae bacterium]MDD4090302.1 hypothetical protein [Acholeplasmataceae bacterium]MDY0115745.1 hypothetical protein [Acholeplasmatales bacterium]
MFHPFSITIFKKVITNILSSLKEHPRSVTLILFYTISEYLDFIDNHTPFVLKMRIKTPNKTDRKQHFLIYQYEP